MADCMIVLVVWLVIVRQACSVILLLMFDSLQ